MKTIINYSLGLALEWITRHEQTWNRVNQHLPAITTVTTIVGVTMTIANIHSTKRAGLIATLTLAILGCYLMSRSLNNQQRSITEYCRERFQPPDSEDVDDNSQTLEYYLRKSLSLIKECYQELDENSLLVSHYSSSLEELTPRQREQLLDSLRKYQERKNASLKTLLRKIKKLDKTLSQATQELNQMTVKEIKLPAMKGIDSTKTVKGRD